MRDASLAAQLGMQSCSAGSAIGRDGLRMTPRGPLVFLHIPKTGGTSVARLMQAMTPRGEVHAPPGNIVSAAYGAELAAAGLPSTALIHGHPGWGACRPLLGKARFVTVLREPRAHVVSHYLHALRDPAMPQHAAVRALGFAGFLRTYVYVIPFQTHALYQSITDPQEERQRAMQDPGYGDAFNRERYFAAQLAAVLAFLEDMMLVGTLARIDAFVGRLGGALGWDGAPGLPHDNAAPVAQQGEMRDLFDQLDGLERDAELAPLFAIERITYGKARSLGRTDAAVGIVVHRSAGGTVALGENFAAAASGGWWTGRRQLSRLRVVRRGSGACVVTLRAVILHGLSPSEVLVCWGGRWLDVAVTTGETGETVFSALLEDDGEELTLYLQWNRYPTQPPFHPAIWFSGFDLRAHAAG